MSYTDNIEELIHLTAKRSAYTREELQDIISENIAPVKVLDFLLVGHFDRPIGLAALKQMGVFGTRPPQSITKLGHEKLSVLKAQLALGFEV